MQAHGPAHNLEHSTCILGHSAWILVHSGTFCMHSGTFWMHFECILNAFWMHSWTFCMRSGPFWNFLKLSGTFCWAASSQLKIFTEGSLRKYWGKPQIVKVKAKAKVLGRCAIFVNLLLQHRLPQHLIFFVFQGLSLSIATLIHV